MHTFSVWAPLAHKISVQVDGALYPMTAQVHGWWSAEVAAAGHGSNYGFLLDDDAKVYPDPRSAWQPDGVHGLSRVLDQTRYQWKDHKADGSYTWHAPALADSVVYELHVGTFTDQGTFASVASRLDDLCALGITHVEIMPVNSFTGRWGWGYDGVDLFAPQESYGGPEGLKHLIDECHGRGLAVLLDVVYNHFGPVGNYTGRFGPYTTDNHHTPWGGAVNLEENGSAEVRRFFCDNALMWLRDYHFDGLRLDAIHSLVDRSAKHFLEQLSEEVAGLAGELKRELVLIAESDLNDPRVVTPRGATSECGQGGHGMDAQWSDDFHHAVFAYLTGERHSYYKDFGSLAQVAKALESAYVFDGIHSEYRQRDHGRPVEGLPAHRFLGYIQNHDQVGNRAVGDRLHAVVGIRKAKLAAALVLTAPFVPMIFQGEEFASSAPFLFFADHEDPELARAVTEGRRREHALDFDWDRIPDPESPESFTRSKLDWSERTTAPHDEMLAWYRDLIGLRQAQPALRDEHLDHTKVSMDEGAQWLVMQRGNLTMYFNFADSEVELSTPEEASIELASDPAITATSETLHLPAESFAVLGAKQ